MEYFLINEADHSVLKINLKYKNRKSNLGIKKHITKQAQTFAGVLS